MAGEVKKLQFSEGTDVGAPTDLSLATATNHLKTFVDDAAFVSDKGTAASGGDCYINSAEGRLRYFIGSAWRYHPQACDVGDATKRWDVAVSGATSGTSTTLSFVQTSSRAISYPDGDGEIILDSFQQTVSNKHLRPETVHFRSTSGTARDVYVNCSGATNSTRSTLKFAQTADRILNVPDVDDTFAVLAASQAFTNKDLTSSTNVLTGATAGSFTNTGTISLPTATTTLVGRATTDTGNNRLQNKELDATSVKIVDPSDTAKKVNFDASNITTANTRTLTIQDKNITVAGTSSETHTSPTVRTGILLQNVSGAQPYIRFSEDPDAGTDYIQVQAPSGVTTSYTLTLPSAPGSAGQSLVDTDGAGTLGYSSFLTDPTSNRGELIRRNAAALGAFSAKTNNRVVRGDGTDVVSGQIDDPGFFTTGAAAASGAIGIVTTGAQDFSGVKTFYDGLKLDDAAGQSTLNNYAETSVTVTFQGNAGGSASSSIGISLRKIGTIVLVELNACADATSASNSTYLVSSAAIPSAFRPSLQDYHAPCIIRDNNAEKNAPGRIQILTTGFIRFYYSLDTGTASFTNAATNGFTHTTATFIGS